MIRTAAVTEIHPRFSVDFIFGSWSRSRAQAIAPPALTAHIVHDENRRMHSVET
eukprot:COSAG01_NODE_3666_length_5799_cov_5.810957_7_plen_54_part_00